MLGIIEKEGRPGRAMTGGLALALLVTAGCGSGAVGDAIKPEAPTASQALGEASPPGCGDAPKYMAPLAVDWRSEDRLELEVAMKDGVAVVRYDCEGVRVLPQCKLDGSYAFAGVSLKEDVIQIESSDELRANLPLSFATLEGEVSGSSTVDLAVALVGKRGTVRYEAARDELHGACDGATHFVRAAMVGAFAMDRGEKGRVRAAAEILGAAAGGDSASERLRGIRDGDIGECKAATPDDEKPPARCSALVRVQLEPLQAQRDAAKAQGTPKDRAEEDPCPEGWALSAGKCAPAKEAVCSREEAKEPPGREACQAACDGGDAEGCYVLAGALPGEEKDKSGELYDEACNRGHAKACAQLAWSKLTTDKQRGYELLDRACALGDAYTCVNTGRWYLEGRSVPKDVDKGTMMTRRSCDLGSAMGCAALGDLYLAGRGVPQDVDKGLALYRRLCDNGIAGYCHQLGSMYARDRKAKRDPRLPTPQAIPRDVTKGLSLWERACALQHKWSCTLAGQLYLAGDGVKKDERRARELFEQACPETSYNWDGCAAAATMAEKGTGGPEDLTAATGYHERACPMVKASCDRAVELLDKQGDAQDRIDAVREKRCRQHPADCPDAK